MSRIRIALFIVITAAGVALMVLLGVEKPQTPLDSSLAPLFQVMGVPARTASRALTRVMPLDSLDEAEFGDAIAARFGAVAETDNRDYRYANELIRRLSQEARKPFKYRAYLMHTGAPNAFALPGGIVFVTTGLFSAVKSEAELAAILAHEIGHIELSHCMDTVRFQLLARKTGGRTAGELADFAVNLLVRHTYSKTQENEADEYAYALILNTDYNPSAVGRVFKSLREWMGGREPDRANVVKDYLSSHPHLATRAEKFGERAKVWWKSNDDEKRYEGVKNLDERRSLSSREIKKEWVTGK